MEPPRAQLAWRIGSAAVRPYYQFDRALELMLDRYESAARHAGQADGQYAPEVLPRLNESVQLERTFIESEYAALMAAHRSLQDVVEAADLVSEQANIAVGGYTISSGPVRNLRRKLREWHEPRRVLMVGCSSCDWRGPHGTWTRHMALHHADPPL
jgi:hypothetical protein